jgi:hypothetical protein
VHALEYSSLTAHDQCTPGVRARVRLLAVKTADHLARSQQFDAAAAILENYVAVHGPEAEILRRLGGLRLRQGRPQEAATLLERALMKHFECGAAKRAGARDTQEQGGDAQPGEALSVAGDASVQPATESQAATGSEGERSGPPPEALSASA